MASHGQQLVAVGLGLGSCGRPRVYNSNNTAFVQLKPSKLVTMLSLQTKFSLVVLKIQTRLLDMSVPKGKPAHAGVDESRYSLPVPQSC